MEVRLTSLDMIDMVDMVDVVAFCSVDSSSEPFGEIPDLTGEIGSSEQANFILHMLGSLASTDSVKLAGETLQCANRRLRLVGNLPSRLT